MANKIELFHEKTNKGSYIQHIKVNGIELSGRNVAKSEDSELYNQLIQYLNDKAQEELANDPWFGWVNLYEWRVWANSYTKEFLRESEEEEEEAIRESMREANK